MRDNTLFKNGLAQLNIDLTDEQLMQFETYYDMLVEKNKVMNLTAITEYDEVIVKHFLDSLSIVKSEELRKIVTGNNKIRVCDIGTGAGFPGIPLKIAFPSLQITLMDSLNKRILFLQDVISELKLKDIEAIHVRCEEIGSDPKYREKYDLAVSRAVAKLNSLSELSIPFVKKSGYFVPYKSGDIDEELNDGTTAVKKLGGTIEKTEKFTLPLSDHSRTLVIIKKTSPTDKKYPRKGGKVFKDPLK